MTVFSCVVLFSAQELSLLSTRILSTNASVLDTNDISDDVSNDELCVGVCDRIGFLFMSLSSNVVAALLRILGEEGEDLLLLVAARIRGEEGRLLVLLVEGV